MQRTFAKIRECLRVIRTWVAWCAGYQDVTEAEKTTRVGQVFESVAPSYDLMNDLMSAGMHRLWKDRSARSASADTC